jgi:glucosamine 6-phosphate synthetase-like amidotransferase/phosphosugar isomerase protein
VARLALALEAPAGWADGTGRPTEAAPVELEPKALRAALGHLPDAMQRALSVEAAVKDLAETLASRRGRASTRAGTAASQRASAMDRCIVVGRGFEYATAREWALKLKELAQVFADPYSAADFLHGPIALMQPGIPVLIVAPSGAAAAGLLDLARDLRDRDIDTVVFSDVEETRALGSWSIELPPGIPEPLRPIVSIVPAQLFAYHLTVAKGLDPETPRGLSKVTRTT